ncbi:MAG TPA: OmpA family protein [Sphingomicrobium sp.]|jgi:peptidoglycan-associated lipoprotein|nr:OmpA family protein [Sphingomicrobium sp.]
MRKALLIFALASVATAASAQLPGLRRRAPTPPVPVQQPIDVLRANFAAQSGGTTVYFANGSAQIGAQATTVLQNQAMWLRLHPAVRVRIEGHGDGGDTRDHALALGARRAEEARAYLVLLGVPSAQVDAMTWGKERPGAPRAVTVIVP